jgi:NAD(P)-dependent dehydrogenase (short-subunit alcohol dehydrogenase family)
MNLNLKGKTALVTGGSKGIGRACAETLAAEGCSLHLAARDQTALRQAKDLLESKFHVSITIHAIDLSIGDNLKVLAKDCSDIDILVNNAGAIPRGDLWQIEEIRWREAWDLKVFGYIDLCRAVYLQMKKRRKGVIINIIGAAGERPRLDYIAGSSANASLMAFTRALGARSLKDGIRVVAVNPGLIKTERLEALLRNVALSRFGDPKRWPELMPKELPPGEPQDVANLVTFLVSDCARYITGTVVTVDGGITAV